jgi:hypothetical protein
VIYSTTSKWKPDKALKRSGELKASFSTPKSRKIVRQHQSFDIDAKVHWISVVLVG